MKIYDYKCAKCDKVEEKFVRHWESECVVCDDCNSEMFRLPPGTRTHFKFADKKLKR